MTDQNQITSNTPEESDTGNTDHSATSASLTENEKVLNSDLPDSGAPGDDYEDNFIEDPQATVPPHSAVNTSNTSSPAQPVAPPSRIPESSAPPASSVPAPASPAASTPASAAPAPASGTDDPAMESRLERLGGEPAPVITPEEFARLQKAGQVHIDERGRVRTARPRDAAADAGVSLRKRRAWYRQTRQHTD